MIQQNVFQMMNAAKERIIKTMQERGITKVNLVMTWEEWAKDNGFDPADDPCGEYDDYRWEEAPYVIYFNKWGNGLDYAAYSVELVDGPEHPRFKLECYNNEEGSETFTDDELTNFSMIGIYDAMEEELVMKAAPQKVYVVTYVGLSDSEYDANGYCESAVCTDLAAAKAKMKAWREAEIENCKAEGRDYEILEDEAMEFRMSWCGHGEQLRLKIEEKEVN